MQTITHPIRQLALVVAGFVVAVVLLESQGLASWADHLDIGPLRTVAVPVTGAIKKALDPIGIGAVREHALQALARVGWSDDAALLADASGNARSSSPKPAECVLPALSNAPNAASIPGSLLRSPIHGSPARLPGCGAAHPKSPVHLGMRRRRKGRPSSRVYHPRPAGRARGGVECYRAGRLRRPIPGCCRESPASR